MHDNNTQKNRYRQTTKNGIVDVKLNEAYLYENGNYYVDKVGLKFTGKSNDGSTLFTTPVYGLEITEAYTITKSNRLINIVEVIKVKN